MINVTTKRRNYSIPVLFFMLIALGFVSLPIHSEPTSSSDIPIDSTTEAIPALAAPISNTQTSATPTRNTGGSTAAAKKVTTNEANAAAIPQQSVNNESSSSNTSTPTQLTDDQKAMTGEQLSNDPDLITPITSKTTTNKLDDYPTPENTDYPIEDLLENDSDIGEIDEPEEIVFDNNNNVPEYARVVLEEKQPDYHPPKGKLFSFIRQHLSKRGQSTKPWAIENDFNGDGKPDWAALMVNAEDELAVIIIYSENEDYVFEILFEGAGKDNNSIKIALIEEKPGDKIGAPYKNQPGKYRTAKLEYPGIHVMYYTQSSSLYYWHNYYFDELLTSQ